MFDKEMFSKEIDMFTVQRPAIACKPLSELVSIADSFSEILTYINDANGTDDCIEQMKYLTAGFVS